MVNPGGPAPGGTASEICQPKKSLEKFSREGVPWTRGGKPEESILSCLVPGGVLAATAGAAMMVTASSVPSSAFMPSSPSLGEPVVTADIQRVWWDRWGRWHPNG